MRDPFTRFGELAARIAVTPNIIRARREDEARTVAHGGDLDVVLSRVEAAADRLEKVASRMNGAVR